MAMDSGYNVSLQLRYTAQVSSWEREEYQSQRTEGSEDDYF